MGDIRFERPYRRLKAGDTATQLRRMTEEEVIEALASASRDHDPYLANTVATEALNRIRRLRAAARNLGEGVVTMDPQGAATYANPMAARLVGLPAEEIVGHNFCALVGLDDCARLDAALEGRAGTYEDMTMTRADGTRFPIACTVAPIFTSAPHDAEEDLPVEGVVIAFSDITDRKRAEAELDDSRFFLRSMLDAISLHVALLDDRGTIIGVNRAWRAFADENGLPAPDHGVGTSYLDVCERAAREGAAEAANDAAGIRDALAGRIHEYFREYPCHGPTQKRWFILRASGFRGRDG
ncbi:MAG: two-component system, chemotaxis family, CheB/CheR fusion protein, partial [Thermoplasmata archaeon]|nr:two-component system, chemotaxis family, CheB/CheR fusion protein [Thermoplasmata archaeon]